MSHDEFRDFVEVRYADLLRTAYLLTGTRHAAEDLVQSCLLRVMRRWNRIDDPLAYLRRAMANQRTSLWRRIRGAEVLTATPPDRSSPDASEAVAVRQSLLDALIRLPYRTRAVVVLRYWEDLSEAETAAVLGCSIGTVKSQASRGLARLRKTLDPAVSRRNA